jgi:Ras-related protein Rab-7A
MVTMQIWDTVGQEKFESINKSYYRGGKKKQIKKVNACVLVFDLTNRKSFERIDFWIDNYYKQSGIENKDFPFVIIGNKCDMENERQTSKEEAESYCKKGNKKYFECSAKEATNVEIAFQNIAENAIFDEDSKISDIPDDFGLAPVDKGCSC